MKRPILVVIAAFTLSACMAPKTQQVKVDNERVEQERNRQRELALDYLDKIDRRLFETAFPLLQSSTVFCKENTRPIFGMKLNSEFHYQEDFKEAARKLFNLDKHLQVRQIIPGSPAAQSSIKIGDKIIAVNNEVLPQSESAHSLYKKLLNENKQATTSFRIKRGEKKIDINIQGLNACSYDVKLSESDAVNAFADGENVVITKGMMRFTEHNQELALVISHEIAHNAMSHITAKRLNSLGGTLLDLAAAAAGVNTQGMFGRIGAQFYSQEFEAEADYVGLYIMARAGISTENAALFWRRMAVEHPGSISSNHASTHPATADRFISIEETIKQINAKQAKGQGLMPDMKDKVTID